MSRKVTVLVAGSGKLAQELLSHLEGESISAVVAWDQRPKDPEESSVVVHSGSGRQLDEIVSFCEQTSSVLLELSTGSLLENRQLSFPVVLCPNTSLLMLKFMTMLAHAGSSFHGYQIEIVESHQEQKNSVAGTAVHLAESLGLAPEKILSIRNPQEQKDLCSIPADYLDRHAYHKIRITDANVEIVLQTTVLGHSGYSRGVSKILDAVAGRTLENRAYPMVEFVENGWV